MSEKVEFKPCLFCGGQSIMLELLLRKYSRKYRKYLKRRRKNERLCKRNIMYEV